MLNNNRIAAFIAEKRRARGLTQSDLAEQLGVSFQSVSKWENGTLPGVEYLVAIAALFEITVDELLAGREKDDEHFSYSKAGVDISYSDSIKREMGSILRTSDPRVLNGVGPFASLYDIRFPDINDPVLVLKAEEPGSKQKLAMEYGYAESICHDMINHLVNDIAVMGARPLAVLDTIVCGAAEKDTIATFVKGIADACTENDCTLVGGETSIQPQVVERGTYILSSTVAGIVSRSRIIDGSAIRPGDAVLSLPSNGLHTNGYSLVRLLMDRMPQIKLERVDGLPFIEQIMKPHTAYYPQLCTHLGDPAIHGLAHITGGGIEGNLRRIMCPGLCAEIDLGRLAPLPIFRFIRSVGSIHDDEMLTTFNCGTGLVMVVDPQEKSRFLRAFKGSCEIGVVHEGKRPVTFSGSIRWDG